jgi:CDP-glycerol glycerophosphotransferase (TagB/SpsB family)
LNKYSDIFYLYLNRDYFSFSANRRVYSHIFRKSLKSKIGSIWYYIRSDKKEKNKVYSTPESLNNKILLVIASKNNYDAMKFLEQLDDILYTGVVEQQVGEYPFHLLRLPEYKKRHVTNCFILLGLILRHGRLALVFSEYIFRQLHYYDYYHRLFSICKPKAIFFSNDHSPPFRSMILAANKHGIPTYYIQHACVSRCFPPLRFRTAFLEGSDAEEKYRKIGNSDTRIAQIGMPKFDAYQDRVKHSFQFECIGIAFNLMDDTGIVLEFVKALRSAIPDKKLILRPHPRDSRPVDISGLDNVEFSDSKKEDVFTFLQHIDVLISGESSIHYEGALLNVLPVGYQFGGDEYEDYYGFRENGLIEVFDSPKAVGSYLADYSASRFKELRAAASRYVCTLGTDKEFRNTELALNAIKKELFQQV